MFCQDISLTKTGQANVLLYNLIFHHPTLKVNRGMVRSSDAKRHSSKAQTAPARTLKYKPNHVT